MSENDLSTDSSLVTNIKCKKTVITEPVKESSDEISVQSPVKKTRTEIRRKSSIDDESIAETFKNVKPIATQKHVRISVEEPLTQKELILKRMSLFDAKNQSLSSGEETNSTFDSKDFTVKWAWKGAMELAKKEVQIDKCERFFHFFILFFELILFFFCSLKQFPYHRMTWTTIQTVQIRFVFFFIIF